MDKMNYTSGMREVFKIAKNEASRIGNEYVAPEHYLLSIIKRGAGIAYEAMINLKIDVEEIKNEIEKSVGASPENIQIKGSNEECKKILQKAHEISKSMNHTWIGTEHVLLSFFKIKECLPFKILSNMSIKFSKVQTEIVRVIENGGSQEQKKSAPSQTQLLAQYTKDITQLASEGKIDRVIGRDKELQRVIRILARRNKNNPLLLGEPGVGKTAIIEGLAQRIVLGHIPYCLKNKRILSLDLTALVAGTKYRGQFEERLKNLLNEIRKSNDIVIFIDEIHTMVGAGSAEGTLDVSNILKPALSRGEIQCIGATTNREFRKYFEKDGALERRFQTVQVDSPTVDNTIEILQGIRKYYEAYHEVKIPDDVIKDAVFLSERYITHRNLPDKAIDVIDEAAAKLKIDSSSKPKIIDEMESRINEINRQIKEKSAKFEFEKCAHLKREREELTTQIQDILDHWLREDTKVNVMSREDIMEVISTWTKIPVTSMTSSDLEKLKGIENDLESKVIGQKDAIVAISKTVRRSRTGLKDPSRPAGVFLFVGPTGVGKTELAKTLAEFLFDNKDSMIRIDMSEYMEKHSVSRLIGSPPGYVGYDEGGFLTERVRKNPYSVILIDELEKAHPDVLNILLQVFDEGHLTSSLGHKVDFKNTFIILTSNVGTKSLKAKPSMGFIQSDSKKEIKDHILKEVKKKFSPEFINRLDDTIFFSSLDKENVTKIVSLLIQDLNKRIQDKNIKIELEELAINFLIDKGYSEEYGARNMKRAIRRYVEDQIASLIINEEISENQIVSLSYIDGSDELSFRVKDVVVEINQEEECFV